MSKILVPEAPHLEVAARETDKVSGASAAQTKGFPALDAAFLGRIYRSMAWFGTVLIALLALGHKGVPATVSFAGGVLLAALLLRAQEIGVRSLMRPSEQLGGFDARLILVFLLPLKFVLMAGALFVLNAFGLIRPGFLALGFFAGQLVIVAKVAGLMVSRAVKVS